MAKSKNIDITKLDLYDLLGVAITATKKEISSSYRKKARDCHPDKNPDDPFAAEKFQKIFEAHEILKDDDARAAYDKVLKAKQAARIRDKERNAKRQKLKEALEAREQAAAKESAVNLSNEEELAKKIARLRKEGERLLEEEKARFAEEIRREAERFSDVPAPAAVPARLKLKWKAPKGDPTNGGYDEEFLRKALAKYGSLGILLLSKKKNGSAIVEFTSSHDALRASEMELGHASNPLQFTWLTEKPSTITQQHAFNDTPNANMADSTANPNTTSLEDLEAAVFSRMMNAKPHWESAQSTTQGSESSGKLKNKPLFPLGGGATSATTSNDNTSANVTTDHVTDNDMSSNDAVTSVSRDYETISDMEQRRATERQKLIEQMMRDEQD